MGREKTSRQMQASEIRGDSEEIKERQASQSETRRREERQKRSIQTRCRRSKRRRRKKRASDPVRFDYIIAGASARQRQADRQTDRQTERQTERLSSSKTGDDWALVESVWIFILIRRAGNPSSLSSLLLSRFCRLLEGCQHPQLRTRTVPSLRSPRWSMVYLLAHRPSILGLLRLQFTCSPFSCLVGLVKTPSCTPYDRLQSGPPSRRFPSQNPRRVIPGRKEDLHFSLSVRQGESGRWMEHAAVRGKDGVS